MHQIPFFLPNSLKWTSIICTTYIGIDSLRAATCKLHPHTTSQIFRINDTIQMGIEILDHDYTYQCCQHTIVQSKSWLRLRSIFPSLRDMFENSKTRIIYEGKYIGGDCHISLIGLKKFVQTREFHLPVQTMVKIHIIRIYLHIVYDPIVLWHKFEIVSQRKHTKPYHTRSLYRSTRWVKLVLSRKKYPKISYNELFFWLFKVFSPIHTGNRAWDEHMSHVQWLPCTAQIVI